MIKTTNKCAVSSSNIQLQQIETVGFVKQNSEHKETFIEFILTVREGGNTVGGGVRNIMGENLTLSSYCTSPAKLQHLIGSHNAEVSDKIAFGDVFLCSLRVSHVRRRSTWAGDRAPTVLTAAAVRRVVIALRLSPARAGWGGSRSGICCDDPPPSHLVSFSLRILAPASSAGMQLAAEKGGINSTFERENRSSCVTHFSNICRRSAARRILLKLYI